MADPATVVAPAPVVAAPATPAPVAPAAPVTPVVAAPPATPAAPAPEPKTLLSEPAKVEPEVKYDLKLPKDSKLTQADQDAVAAFAKEHKIAPEMAQKLLERDHAAKEAFITANQKGGPVWTDRVQAYEKEALMDPDLGAGDPVKLTAICEQGRRVLDKYGTPKLKQYLIDSGMGSNAEVLKMFANLAKASAEDTIVSPQPAAGAPANQTGDLVNMYKPVSQRQ